MAGIAGRTVSTTDVGNAAERVAAAHLCRIGFEILARNWKTKQCEVDIIARKDDVVWFVEVKYRANDRFGEGLDYIGPEKLRHLRVAAELWTVQQGYRGEYTLGAISLTGNQEAGELVEI